MQKKRKRGQKCDKSDPTKAWEKKTISHIQEQDLGRPYEFWVFWSDMKIVSIAYRSRVYIKIKAVNANKDTKKTFCVDFYKIWSSCVAYQIRRKEVLDEIGLLLLHAFSYKNGLLFTTYSCW